MTDITILVLAAGASRRMQGTDKLLMPVDGIAQLRRIALQALMTGCPVLVTLPAQDTARRAALAGLTLTIVPVHDAGEGLSASLRAAGAVVGPGIALMVVPADMPDIGTYDLTRMTAGHRSQPHAILRGAAMGKPGHPVILPADLIPQLAGLTGDSGARDLIAAQPDRVGLVPLPDDRATRDLDTRDAWADWYDLRDRRAKPGPTHPSPIHPSMTNPLAAALHHPKDAVLAMITGVIGASYRSPGAMMCLGADGTMAGSLTNGCIEGDLALQAAQTLTTRTPARLRYGAGSPFFDIRLPCGGGLDVLLVPQPDPQVLADLACLTQCRTPFALAVAPDGGLSLRPSQPTGWDGDQFIINQQPELRILIFGEGPEASVFTRLVHSAGYAHHLTTTSETTARFLQDLGGSASVQVGASGGLSFAIDPWTAVVTFFHDHDKELAVLQYALNSPAFYIGAQGSLRVAETRRHKLAALGVSAEALGRLHAPIGLIRSARDPQTLAVSVLAEIIAVPQGHL